MSLKSSIPYEASKLEDDLKKAHNKLYLNNDIHLFQSYQYFADTSIWLKHNNSPTAMSELLLFSDASTGQPSTVPLLFSGSESRGHITMKYS